MKLSFERWLQTQSLPEEALSIIEEGIKCYKVGAYRASFLMSYYFLLKVLKHRLEQAKDSNPDSINLTKWQDTLRKIQDDSVWDKTVFDTTQWKEDDGRSKIYLISNDLREDMVYWRRKRNDCAHTKDNIISYPHVEAFWLFIQSNLQKFIVNGGREGLLNKIEKHFDSIYTQPGQDYHFLIEQIPYVVKTNEVSEILKDINEILKRQSSHMYIYDKEDVYYSFWRDIAFSPNKVINEGFMDFITSDIATFIEFIIVYPEKLLMCTDKEELIRQLWAKFLFTGKAIHREGFWEIASILLKNEIIPDDEKNSFVKRLAIEGDKSNLNDEQISTLRKYGFFNYVRDFLFISDKLTQSYNGYNNANSNNSFIIFYLKNEPIDDEVVSRLNTLLYGMQFGSFLDAFRIFIDKNSSFVEAFKESVERQGLNLAPIFKEQEGDIEE